MQLLNVGSDSGSEVQVWKGPESSLMVVLWERFCAKLKKMDFHPTFHVCVECQVGNMVRRPRGLNLPENILTSPHILCLCFRSTTRSYQTVSCCIEGRRSDGRHAHGGCFLSRVSPRRPEEWRLCGARSGSSSPCLPVSLQPGSPLPSPQVGNYSMYLVQPRGQ